MILTGAPGTGKTHLAKAIAEEMGAVCEFVQFHPSYDYTDFVEGLRPSVPDSRGNIGFERRDGIFKEFCKEAIASHRAVVPVYSMDEPRLLNDNETDSAIKWFCKTMNGRTILSHKAKTPFTVRIYGNGEITATPASQNEYTIKEEHLRHYLQTGEYDGRHQTYVPSIGQYIIENYFIKSSHKIVDTGEIIPHVFIIDEINRGEISKIFGELFFSIDPGYRGERGLVKTQYQNLITDPMDPFYNGFYVPDNVYIIGTMNDIDRSVESMDFAMRRRFAWVEINISDNLGILNDLGDMIWEVIPVMNDLNKGIWDDATNEGIEGLDRSYHIGPSYFAKLSLYLNEERDNKEEAYRQLWDNHLRGVLFEYLRGMVNSNEKLRMLEDLYYGITKN